MNHYPKKEYMGDTERSNNALHKTKHTRSSMRNYRVGLDPVATSQLASLATSQLDHQHPWLDPI